MVIWLWVLLCMLSSGSESCSMSHIPAGDNTGCFSNLRSEAKFFICLYDKFCLVGFVTMFESAEFGFLPKCASNGAIPVICLELILCFVLGLLQLLRCPRTTIVNLLSSPQFFALLFGCRCSCVVTLYLLTSSVFFCF